MAKNTSNELNLISNTSAFKKSSLADTFKATPLGFVDIGARGGVHELVEPFADLTSVMGFEPNEAECTRLRQFHDKIGLWSRFDLEPIALAESIGVKPFVSYVAPTNDSLLEPNTEFVERYAMKNWEVCGRGELTTSTLDDIVFSDNYARYPEVGEFLKLDTQGTEYEILLGAKRTLNERTVAIVCEVSFTEIYKDQKLFSEIELFLRQFGFRFYGFDALYGRSQRYLDKKNHAYKERLTFTDAVFFKDPLIFSSGVNECSSRHYQSLFVCALLLRYYDFALELASKTWAAGTANKELELLKGLVMTLSKESAVISVKDAKKLAEDVSSDPENANLHVGKFVQLRQEKCDYSDVLLKSPSAREW